MWAYIFRHYQKGLRLDPEHSELKKAYFGLKNLLKKSKSVSPDILLKFLFAFLLKFFIILSFGCWWFVISLFSIKAEDNASKGKLRVAVEEFKAALAVDPDHLAHNVHLHLGLCKVLVRLGRGKDALNSCSEALKIDEELIDALVQVHYNFEHPCVLCFICLLQNYKYFSGPWSPSKENSFLIEVLFE